MEVFIISLLLTCLAFFIDLVAMAFALVVFRILLVTPKFHRPLRQPITWWELPVLALPVFGLFPFAYCIVRNTQLSPLSLE
jgi:hypothetical protein